MDRQCRRPISSIALSHFELINTRITSHASTWSTTPVKSRARPDATFDIHRQPLNRKRLLKAAKQRQRVPRFIITPGAD